MVKNYKQVEPIFCGGIVKIPLGLKNFKDEWAIIDKDDYDKVKDLRWSVFKKGNTKYAVHSNKNIYMHRLIMGNPTLQVDHINFNGLDNRGTNLRLATNSQNQMNQKKSHGKASKYKGVRPYFRKWVAEIKADKKQIHIGLFKTEENAAQAYNFMAERLHGEYARFNVA